MNKPVKRWLDFPLDERGVFERCPLCRRVYCDHTLSERGDGVWYIQYEDGTIKPEKEV